MKTGARERLTHLVGKEPFIDRVPTESGMTRDALSYGHRGVIMGSRHTFYKHRGRDLCILIGLRIGK